MRAAIRLLLLIVVAGASLGASCGQRAVTLMPGVVNDTGNRSLRRAIFSFALERLCPELTAHSLPLRMHDADPSLGRFFPVGCAASTLPNDNLYLQVNGHGYAWSNVTGRVGFEAAAEVEYEHDFFVDGSSMYVYFRQVRTQSSAFKPLMLEHADGGVAGPALTLLGKDPSQLLAPIGQRILSSQLARGFTVVREGDGAATFALGVLDRGQRPQAPFDPSTSRGRLLANDWLELHVGQRDFVGPFTIDDSGHALALSADLQGAAAVDVLVLPRPAVEGWLAQYERYGPTGPSPVRPFHEDTVHARLDAAPGAPAAMASVWRRVIPLPAGTYFLVIDHTATAGPTAPVVAAGHAARATISYAVELVESD